MKINGLDLFSGIGGISLALQPWVRTVGYCDNDRYAQQVLSARMVDDHLDRAIIYNDVTELKGNMINAPIDIISGGFPCQDISVAGLGQGMAGERSSLFKEITRLASELQPTYIFMENVPAITTRGGVDVLNALTSIGYDARWTTLSASAVGANHKRLRWWLLAKKQVAYTQGEGLEGQRKPFRYEKKQPITVFGHENRDVSKGRIFRPEWWADEPSNSRVAHGIPRRVDRLKAVGNSVVPLQARTAFQYLMGLDNTQLVCYTL